MIGSGLHKHVLKNQRCPLSDWETLLRATAGRAGLKFGPCGTSSLPLLWEQLVLEGVRSGLRGVSGRRVKRSRQAHEVEFHLRRLVVDVLEDCAAIHRDVFANHETVVALSAFVRHQHVHIIDFNFDNLLLAALSTELQPRRGRISVSRGFPGRDGDLHNLITHWPVSEVESSAVWKPHGCVSAPESLRLGVRDYGLQPAAYEWAFNEYKAASDGRPRRMRRNRVCDTWIAKMMVSECRIIGLGLSAQEWGLQWLFLQRARNRARHRTRPPAVALASTSWPSALDVETHLLRSWDDAWEAACSGRPLSQPSGPTLGLEPS